MVLQGNLQNMFDALYLLGAIDPVLQMDWMEALDELEEQYEQQAHVEEVITVVSDHNGDVNELAESLKKFDDRTLAYLAMEVAREFANFHTREYVH